MSTQQSPLMPIPKLYIPAAAALVAILLSWIISGDFETAELGALLTTVGYFVLGYVVPTDGVGTRSAGYARRSPEAPAARRPPE